MKLKGGERIARKYQIYNENGEIFDFKKEDPDLGRYYTVIAENEDTDQIVAALITKIAGKENRVGISILEIDRKDVEQGFKFSQPSGVRKDVIIVDDVSKYKIIRKGSFTESGSNKIESFINERKSNRKAIEKVQKKRK